MHRRRTLTYGPSRALFALVQDDIPFGVGTKTKIQKQRAGAPAPHKPHCQPSTAYFFGKFGSFFISRICWMWRSAWVEISSIHCQQSMTSP